MSDGPPACAARRAALWDWARFRARFDVVLESEIVAQYGSLAAHPVLGYDHLMDAGEPAPRPRLRGSVYVHAAHEAKLGRACALGRDRYYHAERQVGSRSGYSGVYWSILGSDSLESEYDLAYGEYDIKVYGYKVVDDVFEENYQGVITVFYFVCDVKGP